MDFPDTTEAGGMLCTDGGSGDLKLRRFVVRVVQGPDAGLERLLDRGTALVGSHPHNDLVLTDPTVSRYHLELQARAAGVRVTDLDSTNGTYLGPTRLGSVTVRERVLLKLGTQTVLELLPADQPVALSPYGASAFGRVFGRSPPMTALFSLLCRVAPTDSTLLIQGETGTGKELLAEAVHAHSLRGKGPFVVVDCGAIARELLAAELFGHARGAFTGAEVARKGLADAASGGTLFLDEVGELPLELQPHLLRLLEKHEVRPVGENRPHRVDVRVVAATNRDLGDEVRAGRFREDLYYRLAVVHVEVPPLRERREDIPALVRIFLREIGREALSVPEDVMQQLVSHPWPGNVRELRNVVERGVSVPSLPGAGRLPDDAPPLPPDAYDLPFKEAKGLLVEAFEKEYLTRLLQRHDGNISRAAAEAGIDRNYIHRLVKRYGLTRR